MSHIATVKCEIKSLDALEEAVQKFNATLHRGKTNFKAYAGTNTKCLHTIELNDNKTAYSIGLRQLAQSEESYELACDWYDGSLAKAFGKEFVNLRNEYQAVVAEKALKRQGWRVSRKVDEAQHIQLYAQR
jgi:hypothetical protein